MKNMSNMFKAAIGILLITILYLYGVTFTPEKYVNALFANRIVTYFQTIITLLIGYYWGTSTKNQGTDPTNQETTTKTIETKEEIK